MLLTPSIDVNFEEMLNVKSQLDANIEALEHLSKYEIQECINECTSIWKDTACDSFFQKANKLDAEISKESDYLSEVSKGIDAALKDVIRIENLNRAMGIVRIY